MDYKKIVAGFSDDEKIAFTAGDSAKKLCNEKFGTQFIVTDDGPHGSRKAGKCYPNICLAACSWDKTLLHEMAASIASDCIRVGVEMMLAPSVNLKRLPICGRNFEYYSEDPLLCGLLASEFVKGFQEKGVATCVKHYMANNQEKERFTYSAQIRDDAFFDIYLKVFKLIIRNAEPKAIMSAYNSYNGVNCSENRYLLKDVLCDKLGFKGLVLSDWGAVDCRHKSISAGTHLDMPGSNDSSKDSVKKALESGELKAEDLDFAVGKIAETLEYCKRPKTADEFDSEILSRIAEESFVLLENNGILPLSSNRKVAVVGEYAFEPKFQGGGCEFVKTAVAEPFVSVVPAYCDGVLSERGYGENAVKLAGLGFPVIFFAGKPRESSSETYDEENIRLPQEQIDALKNIYAVNKNVIVVLVNGEPLELGEVKTNSAAVLETYYAGQDQAKAICRTLFGLSNPSGRLAETFPLKLEDCPAYESYLSGGAVSEYNENLFVGYRHYVSRGVPVCYPFGYGLSYTRFAYSDLRLSKNRLCKGDSVTVTFKVTNEGERDGKEVIQIYSGQSFDPMRPSRELIYFDKVFVKAGETVTVTAQLNSELFEYYSLGACSEVFPAGSYRIVVGKNANVELLGGDIILQGERTKVDRYTTVGQLIRMPGGKEIVKKYLGKYLGIMIYSSTTVPVEFSGDTLKGEKFFDSLSKSFPLRVLCELTSGEITESDLDTIIARINDELGLV